MPPTEFAPFANAVVFSAQLKRARESGRQLHGAHVHGKGERVEILSVAGGGGKSTNVSRTVPVECHDLRKDEWLILTDKQSRYLH